VTQRKLIPLVVLLLSAAWLEAEARRVVGTARFRYVDSINRAAPADQPQPTQPPLIPVPQMRQHSLGACGLGMLQSLCSYYGRNTPRGSQLVRWGLPRSKGGEGYSYADGTPEQTMKQLAERHGLRVSMKKGMRLGELVRTVSSGTPVGVGYQAWTKDPQTIDWKQDKDDGHYSIVLGFGDWNGKPYTSAREMRRAVKRDPMSVLVWMMDPSMSPGKRGWIPLGEFLDRWHWLDASHFGMAVRPPRGKEGESRLRAFAEGTERIR